MAASLLTLGHSPMGQPHQPDVNHCVLAILTWRSPRALQGCGSLLSPAEHLVGLKREPFDSTHNALTHSRLLSSNYFSGQWATDSKYTHYARKTMAGQNLISFLGPSKWNKLPLPIVYKKTFFVASLSKTLNFCV